VRQRTFQQNDGTPGRNSANAPVRAPLKKGKLMPKHINKKCSKFAIGLLLGCLANTNIKAASVCSINTVDDYRKAWNGSLSQQCSRFEIGKNLYGSIALLTNNPTRGPVYVYPSGFQFAWISGSENLEQYLAWRLSPDGNTFRGLTLPIGLYAGLPQSYVTGDGIYLAVIDYSVRPADPASALMSSEIYVPSAAFWFNKLRNLYNVVLQLDTRKTFATNDPNLPGSAESTMVPIDPIANFINMTGASYNEGPKCSGDSYKCPSGNSSCRGWQNVMERLMPLDPYQKGGNTAACVASFNDYLTGRNPTASEYRAMLNRCQDVNPCNTFLGFGYSQDYADYLAALPGRHYDYSNSFTGSEFVVPNIDIRSMINNHQAAFIHLPAPASSGVRP
jgi:hypothetical protein